MTPSERRAKLRQAVENYKELLRLLSRLNNLALDVLAHPDATDEHVDGLADRTMRHRVRARAVYQSLRKAAVKEKLSHKEILWIADNPPW